MSSLPNWPTERTIEGLLSLGLGAIDVALNFGTHEDVVYDRAPLVTVLCQLKFTPVLSLFTRAGVTGFQAGLRDEYPRFLAPRRDANIAMTPEGIEVGASAPVWRMADQSEEWTVGLSVDFVSLETSQYKDSHDFLGRLQHVLHVLHGTVRPSDSTRVGLRKISAIPLPDTLQTQSLQGIVREEMLGPLCVAAFPTPIANFEGHLQFIEDDTNVLMINYGLKKIREDPNLSYVLDCDYFTERPFKIDGGDVMEVLEHFSSGMTSFFHWALEPEYLSTLGPRTRGGAL